MQLQKVMRSADMHVSATQRVYAVSSCKRSSRTVGAARVERGGVVVVLHSDRHARLTATLAVSAQRNIYYVNLQNGQPQVVVLFLTSSMQFCDILYMYAKQTTTTPPTN